MIDVCEATDHEKEIGSLEIYYAIRSGDTWIERE